MTKREAVAYLSRQLTRIAFAGIVIQIGIPGLVDLYEAASTLVDRLRDVKLSGPQLTATVAASAATLALAGNWSIKSREFRHARADKMATAALEYFDGIDALRERMGSLRDIEKNSEALTEALVRHLALTKEAWQQAKEAQVSGDTEAADDARATMNVLAKRREELEKEMVQLKVDVSSLGKLQRRMTAGLERAHAGLMLHGDYSMRITALDMRIEALDATLTADTAEALEPHLRGITRQLTANAYSAVRNARSWWGRRLVRRLAFTVRMGLENWRKALAALGVERQQRPNATSLEPGQEPTHSPE